MSALEFLLSLLPIVVLLGCAGILIYVIGRGVQRMEYGQSLAGRLESRAAEVSLLSTYIEEIEAELRCPDISDVRKERLKMYAGDARNKLKHERAVLVNLEAQAELEEFRRNSERRSR